MPKKKEMIQVYTQHIQSTIAPSSSYAASGQPGLVSIWEPYNSSRSTIDHNENGQASSQQELNSR